jgi:Omp85 superfamily domain
MVVHGLLLRAGMRKLGLLLALLLIPLGPAAAQEPADPPEGATISSAQVSGFDLARLSPGLQQEIGGLAGGALNRERLRALAARIEEEQPRFVAAVRAVQDPDGEVRVVFVVAHRRDKDDRENINERYIVDHAEVRGVPKHDLDPQLLADLEALVGKRLGAIDADEIASRLRNAYPNHEVSRHLVRSDQSGHIRLLFVLIKAESARWLHFEPLRSKFVYHSDQGWSSYLDLPISSRDLRVTPIVAIDNGDDLIEEYGGFGIRFEARKIGTERLGASLEWSTFDQTWRDATLAALASDPALPSLYQTRTTVAPTIRFAFTPHLNLSAGVGITELEPLIDGVDSQTANAAVVSLGFDREWRIDSNESHQLDAAITVRAASEALESDFDYTRYVARAEYEYRSRRHLVLLSGMAGSIHREAPLFERFSLGDSQTLRGWDKYDIAPVGGSRMFHTSLEYRYRGLGLFLDTGSVWDRDTERKVRASTGLTFHPGPVFFTLGFPLNTDDVSAVFTAGLRFSGLGIQKF